MEESDKKAWDGLSDKTKTKIAWHHLNEGKKHVCQCSKVNKMEANECDLIFDESDDDEEQPVEASKHEVTCASDAQSARKMHKDKGIDFDDILQAQQANTRLECVVSFSCLDQLVWVPTQQPSSSGQGHCILSGIRASRAALA